MDYYLSVSVRDVTLATFSDITETIERFSGSIVQVEKDTILSTTNNLNFLSVVIAMKDTYRQARFGFSQYQGLAKGLSRIAKLGEILVSEEVERQIISKYDITSLGMLSIEGMSTQILVCRIERALDELQFPEEKKESLVIARASEIESLENLLRVTKAVLILGPVGSGKTTFLADVTTHWTDREIYQTLCPPYNRGRILQPLIDVVSQIFGISGIQHIAEKQKAIEGRLKELDFADIGTSYVALLDFLGLSEEESILEKLEMKTRVEIITDSVAEAVRRISWRKPVAIIIEDIEHMDASSCNFAQRLMTKLLEEHVIFIFTSSTPQVTISGLKEYELRSIEKQRLEELIEQAIGEKISLPPTTPFHVMQYLILYREEKKAHLYNQYRGQTPLTSFSYPFHDLQTLVKRRLELIDEETKDFLFSCAIAGFELFPHELPFDENQHRLFDYCVTRNYMVQHRTTYGFVSPLLHTELYNAVPDKKNRHLNLAEYYRAIQGFEEYAAFHYLRAEHYKKAIEFLMKSAQRAVKKGAYESGIQYYNEALELCQRQREEADLEIVVALSEGLADIYRALGDEDQALKYYKIVLDSYKEILKE